MILLIAIAVALAIIGIVSIIVYLIFLATVQLFFGKNRRDSLHIWLYECVCAIGVAILWTLKWLAILGFWVAVGLGVRYFFF